MVQNDLSNASHSLQLSPQRCLTKFLQKSPQCFLTSHILNCCKGKKKGQTGFRRRKHLQWSLKSSHITDNVMRWLHYCTIQYMPFEVLQQVPFDIHFAKFYKNIGSIKNVTHVIFFLWGKNINLNRSYLEVQHLKISLGSIKTQ